MTKSAWKPQPGAQLAAVQARSIDELLFGGSRGGGKSDYLLGDYLQDVELYKEHWRGIIFRKSFSELEELISRSKEIYSCTGANFSETKKTWTFPNKATLKLRFLESGRDAVKYQGHQYSWIGWDELGNWSDFEGYNKLKACLRSAGNVKHKRIRASANPGGAGHQLIKKYFIEHAPTGYKLRVDEKTKAKICYIPSRVWDNAILLENDPTYIDRLKGVGSDALVKAWLYGDWDVIEGAYFDTFSVENHVLEPFKIPEHWLKFRSFDWGSSAPSACLWFAMATENSIVPRGSLIVYRELYTMADKPNEGLKLSVEEVAEQIRKLTVHNIDYSVADPSIFKEEGGESIGEKFFKNGVNFQRADNVRLAGWENIRSRLNGDGEKPTLYFFSTCINLIRTLPALQHDRRHPEDLDTDAEDHLADALRYGVNSRASVKEKPEEVINYIKPGIEKITVNDLFNFNNNSNQRSRI